MRAVLDVDARIGVEDHEVGGFSSFERAEVLFFSDHPRGVHGRRTKRVNRFESGLHQ
jgi:hypothetical protein